MVLTARRKAASPHSEKRDGVNMERVATLILGGGQGTRLFPLTNSRCKPAICFGGRYRLIDVPLSNAINSGCHRIFILTQFLSTSLHRYISKTYNLDNFSNGFIDVLSAEQKPDEEHSWFLGTADAVRKNLNNFLETPADYFLILSGDQLYRMDFRDFVTKAVNLQADVVVASLPVAKEDAKRMGVMQLGEDDKILAFHEKPKEESLLKQFAIPAKRGNVYGKGVEGGERYLGSMGIYLFSREALYKVLKSSKGHDFGKDIIPDFVSKGGAYAYIYDGYWEDIGTIESFYQANMGLAKNEAPFDFYNEDSPIYTTRYNLPGPKIQEAKIKSSIICEGSLIDADEVTNSILGPRTVIKKGSVIRDSYLMGSDFYRSPTPHFGKLPEELSVGKNVTISRCILDKNVRIGDNVSLTNKGKLKEYDGEGVYIRDGIIVVSRGANIPDGYSL
jgi:glucose-1-phosphate adenylyltransferase